LPNAGLNLAQQPAQEIVYDWVQWLQSYALSHVGFGDGITIRQSDMMMSPVDVRAPGKIASVESVVQCLMSYNRSSAMNYF
jgi:E3 ubiquitin-protein ligase RNF14